MSDFASKSALVIGHDAELVQHAVDRLEQLGLPSGAVGNPVLAVDALEKAPTVKLVFLQSEDADLARTIRAFLRVLPGLTIVGIGVGDRDAEFRAAGAAGCLSRVWNRDELFGLLTRRIDSCVGCGIELPLRSTAPHEHLQRYACRFCGERYAGQIRDDASEEARTNVRPISESAGRA